MQMQHVVVMICPDHYIERALFHVVQLKAVPGKAAHHSTKQNLRRAEGFDLKNSQALITGRERLVRT